MRIHAWWRRQPPPAGFDTWEEALAAWDVPDDRWDSASAVVDAKVKQLVDAGARIVGPAAEFGTSWMVMQDPEGNEFCVT